MAILVSGSKIKLLDRNLIRRFGGLEVVVDPSVANALIKEGLAIYVDTPSPVANIVREEKAIEAKIIDNVIFPVDIISE
jgi:hypothetical protein